MIEDSRIYELAVGEMLVIYYIVRGSCPVVNRQSYQSQLPLIYQLVRDSLADAALNKLT